jgi:hypothetical protein
VENGSDKINFENDLLKMVISPSDFQIKAMEMKKEFQDEFSLTGAADMYVILKGLSTSLPFLWIGEV